MNPSDVQAVLQWWLVLLLLGVALTPVTFRLFPLFFDKGYPFSKILGSLVIAYLVFVAGITHFAPFTVPTIVFVALVVTSVSFFSYRPKWQLWYTFKQKWFTFAVEELLFLTALLTWSYIHSFDPDIHGLEKFMDFGFVNSLLRTTYFPPKDMWFTPYAINYYYFGHLVTAMLTKLSGLPSYITFNLMLSTIVATCFTLTLSIGSNLYFNLVKNERVAIIKLICSGILTACLTSIGGNLHVFYAFFKQYNTDNPVPMWQLPFKPFTFPNSYWYPNATRFIYHTIHEFPIYSWTVADLHGHVLDIPFVLLTIAYLFSLLLIYTDQEKDTKPVIGKTFLVKPVHLIFISLFLAAMYMTNAWDGGIYLLLTALTMIYIHGRQLSIYKGTFDKKEEQLVIIKNKQKSQFPTIKRWQVAWVRDLALSLLIITAIMLLFATPYNLFFNTSAYDHGIGVNCAPAFLTKIGKIGPFLFEQGYCQHSYWWELFTLYGFFYFFVIVFSVFMIRSKRHTVTDVFVMLMIILATFLIIVPEFFYLKDIYTTYFRANTMFKLVFQAFILLAMSSGYIIVRMATLIPYLKLKQRIVLICFFLISAILTYLVMKYPIYYIFYETNTIFKLVILTFIILEMYSGYTVVRMATSMPYLQLKQLIRLICFFIVTAILVGIVMIYPFLAVPSYYNNFKNYVGLDGITYLKTLYPDDYASINWINKNIKGQPVILEAQGDSYTDYARISANTGLPTVLGWTVHEWLWRGSYSIPAPRITDVQTLYNTTNLQTAKQLFKEYHVQYVYVGNLERQKYPNLNEQKFGELGHIVFQHGNTRIYKLNNL